MTDLFIEENLLSSKYPCITHGNRNEFRRKFNKMFSELPIEQIKNFGNDPVDESSLVFPKITLVTATNIIGKNMETSISLKLALDKIFKKSSGYISSLGRDNKVLVYPLDTDCKYLFIEYQNQKIVFAHYYPKRNMILIFYNLFNTLPRFTIYKKQVEFFINALKDIKFIAYDTSNLTRVECMKRFAIGIKEHCEESIHNIKSYENSIDKMSRELISLHQKSRLEKSRIDYLSKMMNTFESGFIEKLKEIEELSFVKNITFLTRSIKVDVGDLVFDYEGKSTYVGDMSIILEPNNIRIENKYPVRENNHFHVTGNGKCCLGSHRNKVIKLLGNYEYKKLIFFMYTYLKTYTKNDCYVDFSEWRAFRKREKIFDDNGNKIISKKSVVKKKEITSRGSMVSSIQNISRMRSARI